MLFLQVGGIEVLGAFDRLQHELVGDTSLTHAGSGTPKTQIPQKGMFSARFFPKLQVWDFSLSIILGVGAWVGSGHVPTACSLFQFSDCCGRRFAMECVVLPFCLTPVGGRLWIQLGVLFACLYRCLQANFRLSHGIVFLFAGQIFDFQLPSDCQTVCVCVWYSFTWSP